MFFNHCILISLLTVVYSQSLDSPLKLELECHLDQKVTFGYTTQYNEEAVSAPESSSFTRKTTVETIVHQGEPVLRNGDGVLVKLTHDCDSKLQESVIEFKILPTFDETRMHTSYSKSIDLTPQ